MSKVTALSVVPNAAQKKPKKRPWLPKDLKPEHKDQLNLILADLSLFIIHNGTLPIRRCIAMKLKRKGPFCADPFHVADYLPRDIEGERIWKRISRPVIQVPNSSENDKYVIFWHLRRQLHCLRRMPEDIRLTA